MAVTVFREAVGWICRFGNIFDPWRKQPDAKISLEGIIDFLVMDAHMDKIKSLSYMKLLRNCQCFAMAKCLQLTITISDQVTRCNQYPESKLTENNLEMKVSGTNDTDSKELGHQGLNDVDNKMSIDQPDSTRSTINAMESFKGTITEPPLVENPEKVPKGLYVTTFKGQISPPVKSKFYESFTSSDSEGEDDNNEDDYSSYNDSWDDSDGDEDSSMMTSQDFTSACHGMDEYDSSGLGLELSDEEDESDDDILFCDNVESCIPLKRVRFKSQDGFYEVDSRWSDEDLMDARKGQWVEYARDRSRFKRRIEETEKISWIFNESHRRKVFERNRQLLSCN